MEINSNLNMNSLNISCFHIPTDPSIMRDLLEKLQNEIYLSWLKDWDKTNELKILIRILQMILESESIERFFKNDLNNTNYFLNKFSKEVLNNILRQSITCGESGDDIALEVLFLYVKIFLRFIQNANYFPLFENMKDIFDGSRSFYRCQNSYVNSDIRKKKQMPPEFFNEFFLFRPKENLLEVKEGDVIDVHVENKKGYAQPVIFNDKDIWVRGIVKKVEADNIIVKTPLDEEDKVTVVNKNSFEYASLGKMTKDFEWRSNLHVGEVIDCYDRGRWYPATVIERHEVKTDSTVTNIVYKIAFRLFTQHFTEWEKYKNLWANKTESKDSNDRIYFGDIESMDEKIPFYSKRIQRLNAMTSSINANANINMNSIFTQLNNVSIDNTTLSEDLYTIFYIDEQVPLVYEGKKNYIIAHPNIFNNSNSTFSYYYGLLLYKFTDFGGFQILINSINSNTHHEIINIIFTLIYNSCFLLHKDFLRSLVTLIHFNSINYINNLPQNEIRNIKKETIELITRVLRFFLFLEMPIQKINEEIEKFLLNFSLNMLKTNFLDKRIAAIRTIVEILRKNQIENKTTQSYLINILEDYKIFYEIFGPNSHIQLIKYSKDLLEILAKEGKLSDSEIEMIWKATRKGDLEGKLTILKILKEISGSLNKRHLKRILDHIYDSNIKSVDIINEEVNLLFELSVTAGKIDTDEQGDSIVKCINYFFEILFHINSLILNSEEEKEFDYSLATSGVFKYEKEKINLIVEKIVEIAKLNYVYFEHLANYCYQILLNNKVLYNNDQTVFDKSVICLIIIHKFILNDLFSKDKINELIEIFISNFNNYSNFLISLNSKCKHHFKYNNFKIQIKTRLDFLNTLISKNLWTDSIIYTNKPCIPHPIDFIHEIIINKINTKESEKEFYTWLKSLVEAKDKQSFSSILPITTEEKIFKLFNESISNISNDQNIINFTKEAFESYIKIFLDMNAREQKLKINDKDHFELLTDAECVTGYENIWKILILYESNEEVVNKGIEVLLKIHNNNSNVILEKCFNFVQPDSRLSLIMRILKVLKVTIVQSERKGTAGVKSHKSIVKDKMINLNIHSHTKRGINQLDKEIKVKLSVNTTIWELREIISKKIRISLDFFKMTLLKNDKSLTDLSEGLDHNELILLKEEDNGFTLFDQNIEDEDFIKIFNNNLDSTIPQRELVVTEGEIIPEVDKIFNDWYDIFSTNGKMTREDCARFIKAVTNARDEVTPDDHRVNYMFSSFDNINGGFIPRKGFLSFYIEATLRSEKRYAVWENLKNSGYRNDLKQYDEDLILHNNDKTKMPRWILANEEKYFSKIFNMLEVKDENLNREVFDFLLFISTNENIYKQVFIYKHELFSVLIEKENLNSYKLNYCLYIIQSIVEEIDYELRFENDTEKVEINKNFAWIKHIILSGGLNNIIRLMLNRILAFNNNQKEIEISITTHLLRIFRIIYSFALNVRYENKLNLLNDNNIPNLVIEVVNSAYKEIALKIFSFLQNIYNLTYVNTNAFECQLLQRSEIKDAFRILVEGLIPYPPYTDEMCFIDNIIIDSSFLNTIVTDEDEENNLISFDSICTFGLLNEKSAVRKKFSESLSKLIKICSQTRRTDLISHLFRRTYEMVAQIERILLENKNNSLYKNPQDLFEYFSCVLETFYTLREEQQKSNQAVLDTEKFLIDIDPREYLLKITQLLRDDIENKNNVELNKVILIGYLKILSKVCENHLEIKKFVCEFKTNMLELILKNVLFRNTNTSSVTEIVKGMKFINVDQFNDNKQKRNEDSEVKSAWYRLIISLLKGSLRNFEKFFEINLLENTPTQSIKEEKEGVESGESSSVTKYLQSTSPKAEGHVGLRNLGCICYMNSMVQQLFLIPTFRYAVLQIDDGIEPDCKNETKIDDNFLHQLQKMFTFLEQSNREDYNPQGFCYSFKDWEGNPTNLLVQQDSQEFLSRFTDKLENAIRQTPFKYLLEATFGGKTCSQLRCEESCGAVSFRYEDFCTLSLELINMKTIHESLEKFISPEKIEEYNCSNCKKKVTITKRNLIAELPNVLIVHFQRIFYNYEQDRNEKINSRLEFPKVLNMKSFTLEENSKKENNDEEIYYKHDDYYEYFLVGVIVHIGSADAGHYFSFINTKRDGDDSLMYINKEEILNNINDGNTTTSNWLKFNDSRISIFDIKKLEEECYGGKVNEDANANNLDSIQSAYMAIYERKLKTPMKILLTDEQTLNYNSQDNKVIEFREEEAFKIKKQFSIPYNYGKPEYDKLTKKLFEENQIFHDISKKEYFFYKPFYDLLKNKLIPQRNFLEVLDDNTQFQKLQNVSDENFLRFFEDIINELSSTIKNNFKINEAMTVVPDSTEKEDKFINLYLNFIFNLLSSFSNLNKKEENEKTILLKTAAEKLITIVDLLPSSINQILKFYIENKKKLLDCLFNDNTAVVEIHANLLYDVIKKAYEIKKDKNENIIKIIDFILGIFPNKIYNRYVNKIVPIYAFFKNIASLSEDLLKNLANKEFLYVMITYLLGRDSPCYKDSLKGEEKHWDVGRPVPSNFDDLLTLIFQIYKNFKETMTGGSKFKLSDRDKKCIQSMTFLRLIYKSNVKFFSDFVAYLSFNDGNYTRQACIEITRYIDDISYNDDYELYNLFQSIRRLLLINDDFQMFRFVTILGYPQLLIEETHFNTKFITQSPSPSNALTIPPFPLFGFHNMMDFNSKVYEYRGLVNYRTTCCFLKKLLMMKNKEKIVIEIFLLILNSCIENQSLLKYIRHLPSEEPYFEDFTKWGVALIHHYTTKTENSTYLNILKSIVEKINPILSVIINDNDILKNFKGYVGKYLNKDIKREEFSIVFKTENLFIVQINYYTNTVLYNKELDFGKSYSNKPIASNEENQSQIDQENNIITSENVVVVNMNTKPSSERDWIRKIIPVLSHGKKIIVQNPFRVEIPTFNLIRFVAFNNSPREANIHFSIRRSAIHNPINEFIPIGNSFTHITTPLMPYITKNILSLPKINPSLKWSFESDKGLSLNFENTKIDYVDSIAMTMPTKSYFGMNEYPNTSLGGKYSNNVNMNIKNLINPYHSVEEEEYEDKIKQ